MRIGKAAVAAAMAAILGIADWAPARPPQKDSGAAIRAIEQNWAKAFETKNDDEIMRFYAPRADLVVFDVFPPGEYVGYDAYKKDWTQFFATFSGPVTMEISHLAVGSSGNLAYSHSFQTVRGKGKDGKPMDMTVRVTDIYRKLGGKWLIVHEHVSVPVDIQTMKPDLHSKP